VEVGGLRVGLVGARGVEGLSGVLANLIFFFGFWAGFGGCGLSGKVVGPVRFFWWVWWSVCGWWLRRSRGLVVLPIGVC